MKSIHFCTAVQLYPDTWSLQLSFFFLPFLCPPILLNGHLVKSYLHRLTAIEVLEKKPDPCTYTLTNRIKMSKYKRNISLCFPVRFCQYHLEKLTEEHLQQVNLFLLALVSHICIWLWIQGLLGRKLSVISWQDEMFLTLKDSRGCKVAFK